MSIKYAVLGFLSRSSLTGYDLKKLFAESMTLHWSGNNNQIYRTLVELHQEGLVTKEVEYQENLPPRKVYTITESGQAELKQWLLSTPELPQLRNAMLIQLTWADQLQKSELEALFNEYEEEVQVYLLMLREQHQRDQQNGRITPRQRFFADTIMARWISFYESELDWIRTLRQQL